MEEKIPKTPEEQLVEDLDNATATIQTEFGKYGMGLNITVEEIPVIAGTPSHELYEYNRNDNRYIFLASLVKLPIMMWYTQWLTEDPSGQRQLEYGKVPFAFTQKTTETIASELVGFSRGKPTDAYVSGWLWDKFSELPEFLDLAEARSRTVLHPDGSVTPAEHDKLDEEQSKELTRGVAAMLSTNPKYAELFAIPIDRLIQLTLGPSSNFTLYLLRETIPGYANKVQEYVDEFLRRYKIMHPEDIESDAVSLPDREATDAEEIAFRNIGVANCVSITGSDKAKADDQNNFGGWDEILTFYRALWTTDTEASVGHTIPMDLMRLYAKIFQSMDGKLSPNFEFGAKNDRQLHEMGFFHRGKLGFFVLPAKYMGRPFMGLNRIDAPSDALVLSASSVNLVNRNGRQFMISYSIAAPVLSETGEFMTDADSSVTSSRLDSMTARIGETISVPVMKYLKSLVR